MQTLTVNIKLLPTKEQAELVKTTALEYIKTINSLVSEMVKSNSTTTKTSKDINAPLNSSVKNQAIRDAKSVFKKSKKLGVIPVLKKPIIIWNNQNFSVTPTSISMPFIINGKSKKVSVKALVQERDLELLSLALKIGTLRVNCKNKKWIAQISIEVSEVESTTSNVMGVDLGIKVPAVCVTDTGKVKFVGNGRENKYIRRKHKTRRKKLGKAKKLNAIKKINNKEQRWLKDKDHKISREIIDFAVENSVETIRLEQLSGIRKKTRKSRKNNYSLNSWSFYRLAMYIEYKARLVGITVEYVEPAYTSQICPKCKAKNKASDRLYKCSCGYTSHRDIIGAKNIINAPVLNGKSLAA